MEIDSTKSVMRDESFVARGRLQKDAADSLPTFTAEMSLKDPTRAKILHGTEVVFDGPVSELHPELQQLIREQCEAAVKSR